jgi:hypothetical protein
MTKKEVNQLAKKTHENVDDLLAEMTAVLEKRGHKGVRVTSFEMAPTAAEGEAPPAAAPRGCGVLPNGTIFCG